MFSVTAIISRTNEKGEQVYQVDPKEGGKALRVKITSEPGEIAHLFKLTEAICEAFRQPNFEKEYFRWLILASRCRQILPKTGSKDLLYVLEDTNEPLKNFSALNEVDADLNSWLKDAPKKVDGEASSRLLGTYALFVNPPLDPFNNMTEALYMSWIHKAAPLSTWKVYYPSKSEFPTIDEIKQFDGVVLTGSTANLDEPEYEHWINPFIKLLEVGLATQKTKYLGICFGHQIIAKTLGGEVKKRVDEQFLLGTETVEFTPELKAFPCFQKFITTEGRSHILISEAHGREVTILPPKAVLGGFSKNCATEIYHIGDRILCFQGHPEYAREYITLRGMVDLKVGKEEAEERYSKPFIGNESAKNLGICVDYLFS